MPERIALTRLIIGGGKERRDVPAGSLVMLSDEDAAHLDARGAVQKPAEAEREARVRGDTYGVQSARARRERELSAIWRPHRMVISVGVLGDLIFRARRWERLHVDRA